MKEIINKNCYKIKQIIKNYTGEYNEDLEQEVYIRTYKNLNKYIEQNKFTQWICTIAANLCRDYLRSSYFKNKQITDLNEDAINNLSYKSTPETQYSTKETVLPRPLPPDRETSRYSPDLPHFRQLQAQIPAAL